ncbi:MAG: GNAT family N-acetyltransferase [Pseudomonadota bacterium]
MEIVEIAAVQTTSEPLSTALLAILDNHATETGHPWRSDQIRLEARLGDTLAGGLSGRTQYGWMEIRLLAVDPAFRGQGVGRALMRNAERHAQEAGCPGILVETMDFQAPSFYAALGFTEAARLPGHVPAEDRLLLRKDLTL